MAFFATPYLDVQPIAIAAEELGLALHRLGEDDDLMDLVHSGVFDDEGQTGGWEARLERAAGLGEVSALKRPAKALGAGRTRSSLRIESPESYDSFRQNISPQAPRRAVKRVGGASIFVEVVGVASFFAVLEDRFSRGPRVIEVIGKDAYDEFPYKCVHPGCMHTEMAENHGFKDTEQAVNHVLSVHWESAMGPRFVCPDCELEFPTREQYRRHPGKKGCKRKVC